MEKYFLLFILFSLLILILYQEDFFNISFNDDVYDQDKYDKIENNKALLNDYTIENDFNCYIYGCNSSRNDMIEWIGTNEDNKDIFRNNNDYFVFDNGFLNKLDNINENKVTKNYYSINIPTTISNNKLQLKINLKHQDYTLCGYLTNNYYHLQYLLYYKPIQTEVENDILFEYIAVKIINNEYKTFHTLPLRSKIENLETIWINYGPLMLGPFVFTTQI